jgi:hypothetical protein
MLQRDFPCAVLQQKQLLLNCTPEELVCLCMTAAANTFHGHSQQQQQQLGGFGLNETSTFSKAVPMAALCQLLDCSNGVCAAALEVVNLTVRHKLQQQQQKGASAHDGSGMSWLARQWLTNNGPDSSAGYVSEAVMVPDLALAKRLLLAATGVDQQLKQFAKAHATAPM